MKELAYLLDKDKPLVESVTEALRGGVSKQIIKSGEKITEASLAKSLGVSRTPVREALWRLEAEGFFQSVPGHGFTAVKYSYEEIINLYVVRETLEGLAARLAAENISSVDLLMLNKLVEKMEVQLTDSEQNSAFTSSIDFHNAIARATKNPTLINFLDSIYTSIKIFRQASFSKPERNLTSFAEHKAIADAIAARSPELAELRAREHMQKALKNLVAYHVDNLL